MIQPERFSDLQQIFDHFRKVTSTRHFLRSKDLLSTPRWRWLLLLSGWLVMIGIVHRFISPSVLRISPLVRDNSYWITSVYYGTIFSVPLLVILALVESRRIIRGLKKKKIPVQGWWNWFSPEVQELMFREFTDYLKAKCLCNPEALSVLLQNARDEIEARWRAITAVVTVVLTLITLTFVLQSARLPVGVLLRTFQKAFSLPRRHAVYRRCKEAPQQVGKRHII
jgi:hypothetical protein